MTEDVSQQVREIHALGCGCPYPWTVPPDTYLTEAVCPCFPDWEESDMDGGTEGEIPNSRRTPSGISPKRNGAGIYSHHTDRGFGGNKSPLPIRSVEDLISEAGEDTRWVVEDVLARGAVTDFSGLAKKGGKTTFWNFAIAAGALGEDHAGFSTKPAKYLYLSEQGNNFADALRGAGLDKHPEFIKIVQFKDVAGLPWEELILRAGEEAHRLGLDAMIVDTFAAFARLKGSEENDAGAIGSRMNPLRRVAQTYDLGVVLIRHAGKDGSPRGSSAFEAEADICVTLSRPEGRHAPNVRKIAGIGRYGEWERNIQLDADGYRSLGSDDRVEFNKAVQLVKAVLPISPEGGMKKQALLDRREDIAASTLDRALRWMVKQGDVGERQLVDQRGKPKVYWLAHNPPGDIQVYSNQTTTPSRGFGGNNPKQTDVPPGTENLE